MSDNKNRLEDKLDTLFSKLSSIDVTLAEQHISLKEHMRRSDALEKHLETLRNDITPIQAYINMLKGSAKVIALSSTMVGILLGLLQIFKH